MIVQDTHQVVPADDQLPFVCFPTSATTLDGFRRWALSDACPEHVRATYVNQQIIIDMTNEAIEAHVKVKTELTTVINHLVRQLDLGEFLTDGVLISNVDANVSNNPDGSFVSWESFETGLVRRLSATGEPVSNDEEAHQLEGSPDWILEIVSKSSVDKDTRLLPVAYHDAKVKEFWLIDARGNEISFSVFVYTMEKYVAAECQGKWQRSPVFDRWFSLERDRSRGGTWRYQLLVSDEPAA